MCTLANSEGPDEMLHNETFHQGPHCLLRQNLSSEKVMQFDLEIITCDPSIYTRIHLYRGVSGQLYCIWQEGRIHYYITG